MGISLLLLNAHAFFQFEHPFVHIYPVTPGCRIFRKEIPGQNAITRSVLNIHMQIGALHRNNNIEVDLKVVRYALLDRKEM